MTFLKQVWYGATLPTKGGIMPYRDPTRPKRFVLQLSIETHRQLKILAAKLETTMDKLVNQLIEDRVKEEEDL